MKSLWNYLAALPVPAEEKYRRALWLLVPLAALAGLLVWRWRRCWVCGAGSGR